MSPNEKDLIAMGYEKKYDYSQYSHDHKINIIPEDDFKRLTSDVFKTIAENLKQTYGPYGSIWTMTNTMNGTTSTKDGYNAFRAMKFSDRHMHEVYLTIQDIIDRVNTNVGDGTTSCMLLADKMFDSLRDITSDPDEKRKLAKIFNDIESYINDPSIASTMVSYGYVKPLDTKAFKSVIRMASNNDEELTNIIAEALNPSTDEDGKITSIDNVIIEASVDSTMNTEYNVNRLPGKYRVDVEIGANDARMLSTKQTVPVLVYDHNFTEMDFGLFIDKYKLTLQKQPQPELLPDGSLSFQPSKITFPPVLILVKELNEKMRTTIKAWLANESRGNRIHQLYFGIMKGNFVKTVIEDFCAATGIKPVKSTDTELDISYFDKTLDISLFSYNQLCVYDCEKPSDYIHSLEIEMEKDKNQSFVRRQVYKRRIDALSMNKNDTIIRVVSPNALESKVVKDQIQDCISVINSAMSRGYSANLIHYGVNILEQYKTEHSDDQFAYRVADMLIDSCKTLFEYIWKSKYTFDTAGDVCSKISKEFYQSKGMSFDILTNSFIPMEDLATSSQYDIEIISAALSIVKYLITSRGCIFDASLLTMSDSGSYSY